LHVLQRGDEMIPFYENHPSEIYIVENQNMVFPAHLHASLEMIYVVEGSIGVSLREKERVLLPGDFALIFPNTVHSYETAGENGSRQILVISDPSWAGSWLNTLTKYEPDDPFLPATSLHEDIPYAMRSLLKERAQTPPEVCKAYIQLILARALPAMNLVRHSGVMSTDAIYRMIRYTSENYHQPITLDGLAAEVGISKYHLSRIFSTKLHTSFTDYLNSFRIGLAKNLLETSDMDILQICYSCGFESQRTFNRVFKNACGVSPRDFRGQMVRNG
jgi:AraC-like DNA-binding protein/mannose-6-phosphate isomerase-like protein (cupin superfamily)